MTSNAIYSQICQKLTRQLAKRFAFVSPTHLNTDRYVTYTSFHKSYGDQEYNYNRCFKQSNKRILVSMLGVLGLFDRVKASDIEEEKVNLSNEEKMKKMTPAELLIARGVLSMCDQEYMNAQKLFHEALELAQRDRNDEQETLILNLLASNYFESGQFDLAEKLFIDIMKRMINKSVEPTDPAILELSLKLASIYSRNRISYEKAMKGFKFVIESLLTRLESLLSSSGELETQEFPQDKEDELALLGWSYDWFAKHLINLNDYDGAASLLKKALEISSSVLGPLHDQTLILLNDVGTTLAMNNLPEEGEKFMQKAVEGAIESQSKELASFYLNLGLVNLNLRQLIEAKRYCEYSIEMALKNREHHNYDEVIKLSQSCLTEVERLSKSKNQ